MASAGTVVVDFSAETAKFTAELKKVQGSLARLEGDFKRLDRVAGVALRFFSGAALVGFAKQAFNAADAIGDAAERAGIAVESFSRLKFAAEQSDVELQTLTVGLRKFQVELSKATERGNSAAGSFSQIGLDARRLKELAPEQQLTLVADAFGKIKNPADRAAVAADLFGIKAGQQFTVLLRSADGFKKLTAEADRLGITMSGTTAAGIDQADAALKRLKATAESFTSRFLAGLSIVVLGAPDEFHAAEERIRQLESRRNALLNLGADKAAGQSGFAKELRAINEELATLMAQQRVAMGLIGERRTSGAQNARTGLPINALPQVAEFDLDAIRRLAIPEDTFGDRFDSDVFRAQAQEEFRAASLVLAEETANRTKEIEAGVTADLQQQFQLRMQFANEHRNQMLEAENSMQALREATLANGLRALQTFAGGSKKVAIALVLINKAQAISQAVQLGGVAIAQAAASAPPPLNAPAIFWAKAFTAANVAAIAATGFGEIRAIRNAGGAAPGSAVNPIFTNDTDTADAGATTQRTVQVIIQGNVIGNREFIDQLIEDIKDAVDDRDVVIISPTSRNAKDLVGA